MEAHWLGHPLQTPIPKPLFQYSGGFKKQKQNWKSYDAFKLFLEHVRANSLKCATNSCNMYISFQLNANFSHKKQG